MLTDTIKAALLEEIRFAKRQQWTITAAVVALIAGAYSIAVEKQSLAPWEKAVAAILIVIVVVAGIYWLLDLQGHLYRTRLRIDPYDPDPWWRGSEIIALDLGNFSADEIAIQEIEAQHVERSI
jgi:hypothetical protein